MAAKRKKKPPTANKAKQMAARFKPGFLEGLDKRTDLYKTLMQRKEEVIEDLGGHSEVSSTKSVLVERFVWLSAMLETLELDLVEGNGDRGETFSKWNHGITTLGNLANKIGLKRHMANGSLPAIYNNDPLPEVQHV